MIVFGGVLMMADEPSTYVAGGAFIVEGLGDLITGKHHYVSTNTIRYVTGGRIDIKYD